VGVVSATPTITTWRNNMDIDVVTGILSERYGITLENTPSLNDMIRRSVNYISVLFPILESGTVTTEKNKTRYTAEIPEEHVLIKIKEVFYNSPPASNVFNDPDIPVEGLPYGQSLSQRFTDVFEHETRRRLKPVDARIVNTNQFDLIPTPQDVRTIYFEYERYRTIDEIPQLLEEELMALIMFYSNDESYQKQRKENNGSVFEFDRRGNTKDKSMDIKTDVESRKIELNLIKDDIKKKVQSLG
jgi:hypothetical protein